MKILPLLALFLLAPISAQAGETKTPKSAINDDKRETIPPKCTRCNNGKCVTVQC